MSQNKPMMSPAQALTTALHNAGSASDNYKAFDVVMVSADVTIPVSAILTTNRALPVSTGVVTITATSEVPVSTGIVTVTQSAAVSTMLDPYGTVSASVHVAAAASTAYRLPNQACVTVAVKAHPDNAGNTWIGPSGVTNTGGFCLDAGDGVSLRLSNVNKLYYWTDTAADRICWIIIS